MISALRLCLGWALAGLAAFASWAQSPTPPPTPKGRVLTGFDGLPFGSDRQQITRILRQRHALRFETARVPDGSELRYRTTIGDLPFDVFLQFEPDGGWRRASVHLAGHTFGQGPEQCAALHARLLYLVSVEHGGPNARTVIDPKNPPAVFTQSAEFGFANAARITVHNRYDADTCYNHVVYDATTRWPPPSTF